MMKLISTIKNVRKYTLLGDEVVFLDMGKRLKSENREWVHTDVYSISSFYNHIFVQKVDSLLVLSIDGLPLQTFPGKHFLIRSHVTTNYIYILSETAKGNIYFYYNRMLEQEQLRWQDSYIKTFKDTCSLSTEGSDLISRSLASGVPLWQLSFSDLLSHEGATLHSPLVEHQGRLYFFVDGAPGRGTFCVDIASGEVLGKYPQMIGHLMRDGHYIYVASPGAVLRRLDTLTGHIEEWEVRPLLVEHGLGEYLDSHRHTVQGGLVYFTQSMGVERTTVGLLDFEGRALLWHHQFARGVGAIGSIQAHGRRLYVHTQDNTLHVFEQERG